MNRRAFRLLVGPTVTFLLFAPATTRAAGFGMTPQQFWRTAFGSPTWNALAGDADGDGHGDLIAVGADGDSVIAIARTSPVGKPIYDNVARPSSGRGLIATACGSFARKAPARDVAMVFADGSIRVASGMAAGTNAYERTDAAGQIPENLVPRGATRAAVADFDGDAKSDILMLGENGTLLLLRNAQGTNGAPRFAAVPIRTTLLGARGLAAGIFPNEKTARCVWLDASGAVRSAPLELKPTGVADPGMADLGGSRLVVQTTPDEHLAVGRFRGAAGADIIVGQRLFAGGNPKISVSLEGLPPLSIAKDDGVWDVADIDGNGKDDLIRHHEGKERFGAQDVYIHFSYDASETTKGYYSTANDGLPDVWKTGKIKPGGLDLAALGCKIGRRDVIVEIERFEDHDLNDLKDHMDRAVKYFASIPLVNPDGTTGIALHVVYKEPWSRKDRDRIMNDFDGHFPPMERRGVVHTMFAEANGPLVSQINGANGHFNGHWYEFTHEFGHQLDLSHNGFYPSGSPGWNNDVGAAIYPSLMSYTYSYALNGGSERVGYSDGARAGFRIDERHLSERLPFPIETVHFLGEEPYHYSIRSAPDGKSTLIDWNWNGVLGEEDVQADIDYTHGLDFGPQYTVAKTKTAPVLVLHGGSNPRPLLIYGTGSGLASRAWIGTNRDTEGGRWSDEVGDAGAGMTGDPTAATIGEATWIAYPTARGVVLRRVTLEGGGKPVLGAPNLVQGTVGVEPTVTALGGRLALLLWRSKIAPVSLRLLTPAGAGLNVGSERSMGFVSDVPVGAVAGAKTAGGDSLWIARIQSDGDHAGRSEAVRYEVGPSGEARAASRSWITGVYARHRATLLWRDEGPSLPEGRLYHLSGGSQPGGAVGTDQYISLSMPYPERGGWFLRRYQQPSFTSHSAPGACFFEGHILYAIRRYDGDAGRNDALNVAFYGDGAGPWPMGDFDDLGHIRDYGLSRSIRGVPR